MDHNAKFLSINNVDFAVSPLIFLATLFHFFQFGLLSWEN